MLKSYLNTQLKYVKSEIGALPEASILYEILSWNTNHPVSSPLLPARPDLIYT